MVTLGALIRTVQRTYGPFQQAVLANDLINCARFGGRALEELWRKAGFKKVVNEQPDLSDNASLLPSLSIAVGRQIAKHALLGLRLE